MGSLTGNSWLAGTRRFIAQCFTGFTNEYAGTLVKAEDDPQPRPAARQTLAAIWHVGVTVLERVPEGIVLRFGLFYGHGAAPGIYHILDDEPAPAAEWVPFLARRPGAGARERYPRRSAVSWPVSSSWRR